MKWLWLFAVVVIVALIMTCVVIRGQECADQFAKKQVQQDAQFKTAEDILRDFPTAAGNKGRMP
jgi:hypothetical protein